MAKIEVRCPVCTKWENIEISDDATANTTKGLLAVNIEAGMICDHTFIAYVDKNLTVRDCLIADFEIEVSSSPETEDGIANVAESINHDLIRLNIPEILMASIFKAIFSGKNVIIISDDEFIASHIIQFFKYAMQNLFHNDIITMSKAEFKNSNDQYENHIVFDKIEVIQDRYNTVDPKTLLIEKSIARKFLEEYNLVTGLIILRNEIQKAFEFSKTLSEFIKDADEKALTAKILNNHIKEVYNEKIQINYLNFLLNILKQYFNLVLPDIKGLQNFLRVF
ncbi:MAG: hypothetical protein KGD58_04645 [Candidatus Lokiarchaeota archaeon]|nr:hypothetical protein [Candidatus Lokiarchaeota archaeon]